MKSYIFFFLVLFSFFVTNSFAQKPKWHGHTPSPLNNTYKFVEIQSHGKTLELARSKAKEQLEDDKQVQEGVRIYRKTIVDGDITKHRQNGHLQKDKKEHLIVKTIIDGEQYFLQAVRVDDFSYLEDGEYKMYTLFQVATCDNPVFDDTYTTTSYGATPAVMSIIPGLGQIYKGSTIKGICMFAGVAACGIGALVCESQRSDYKNKMKEQPQFAKDYNTKANNWETGRNVCLGAAAAVWIYNIIDAAVAKGARKIIVKPKDGNSFSLYPIATPHSMGLALTYNF